MTQYYHMDMNHLYVNRTASGLLYMSGELTDQYEDTDSENIEFHIGGLDEALTLTGFLKQFIERMVAE